MSAIMPERQITPQ